MQKIFLKSNPIPLILKMEKNEFQKKGFQHLIYFFEQSKDGLFDLLEEEFLAAFNAGVKEDPEKFPELIFSYMRLIRRVVPEEEPDFARRAALNAVSTYCFLADHGAEGNSSPDEAYIHPKAYGPAMELMSQYVGVKGWPLIKFLMEKQYRQ